LSPSTRIIEKAIGDICFPLHNHFRYIGQTESIHDFEDLVRSIGSNKMKISGNKVYLINNEDHKSEDEELQNELAEVKPQNQEKKEESKAKKFISTLKDHLENFSNDEKSHLEGNFKIMNTETKLWPLNEVFTLKKFMGLRFTSTFPMMSIRNYFGPKIALYFFFVGFLINRLMIIGIVGLIVFLLYSVLDILIEHVIDGNQDPLNSNFDLHSILSLSGDIIIWLFSIYVFVWGFRFARDWEVHEKLFQINNGDIEENLGNHKDEERVNIKNYYYTRSLITDNLNTKSNNYSKMYFRFVLVVITTFLIGCLCIGSSISILELKHYLVGKLHIDNVIFLDQQIGNVMEMLKIHIMDLIFSYLSIDLIKWVDPIKKSDFEKQLVLLNLLFIIMNHFGMIILIRTYLPFRFGQCSVLMSTYDKVYDKVILQLGTLSTVEQNFYDSQKISLGCGAEIRTFFASYTVMNFLLSVIRVIYTKVRVKKLKKNYENLKETLIKAATKKMLQLKKKKTEVSNKLNPNTNTVTNKETRTGNNETKDPTTEDQKKEKPENINEIKAFDHDIFKKYYKINCFIEHEIYLENFNESDDVDSTIRHFNQIFVMFMALTLFGMLFPASFFLYYFSLIMEIYNDREEFLFISRRPAPKEMNSIGFFKYFLEICPKLSMLTISYYLSFYLLRITLNINYIYMSFIFVFVSGIFILQGVYAINPKGTSKMKHLIERQKYLSKNGSPLD
jgi:hypothetical protein